MDAKSRKLHLQFSRRALMGICTVAAVILAVVVTPGIQRHRKSVQVQRLGASVQYGDSVYPSFVNRLLPPSFCRPITKVSFLATNDPSSITAWHSDHGSYESEKAHVVKDLPGITDALRDLASLEEIWLWRLNHEHMAFPLGRSLPETTVVLVDGGLEDSQIRPN